MDSLVTHAIIPNPESATPGDRDVLRRDVAFGPSANLLAIVVVSVLLGDLAHLDLASGEGGLGLWILLSIALGSAALAHVAGWSNPWSENATCVVHGPILVQHGLILVQDSRHILGHAGGSGCGNEDETNGSGGQHGTTVRHWNLTGN